jgi:hypothetical protein
MVGQFSLATLILFALTFKKEDRRGGLLSSQAGWENQWGPHCFSTGNYCGLR